MTMQWSEIYNTLTNQCVNICFNQALVSTLRNYNHTELLYHVTWMSRCSRLKNELQFTSDLRMEAGILTLPPQIPYPAHFDASSLPEVRASPPIPPNANGGRALMQWAGHLAVAGVALRASGPGHLAGNGTTWMQPLCSNKMRSRIKKTAMGKAVERAATPAAADNSGFVRATEWHNDGQPRRTTRHAANFEGPGRGWRPPPRQRCASTRLWAGAPTAIEEEHEWKKN